MKEAATVRGSDGNAIRSAMDKEKTRLRERERRSITTNIFQGLRKHGGYRLSPRADINQLLRHLAQEAGWIVEPDGTTYRSRTSTTTKGFDLCPICGAGRRSGTSTPTSSSLTISGRPENALKMYMYSGVLHNPPIATGVEAAAYHHNQPLSLEEAKNTPVGSPPRLD